MSAWIDLNADLGEGEASDAELMTLVSSCNIACGGHAGDDASMQGALALAAEHGVAAGAHPSYPDREGFGRRAMDISGEELAASLSQQIEALKAHAAAAGIILRHLKPHGALYNAAAKDFGLAETIAVVTVDQLPGARLVGPPRSELERAARDLGLGFIAEGFADRAYTRDGDLVARTEPGAVLEDNPARSAQALQIAKDGTVTTIDGHRIALPAQTICLHGDTPGAAASARAIRAALEAVNVAIHAPT